MRDAATAARRPDQAQDLQEAFLRQRLARAILAGDDDTARRLTAQLDALLNGEGTPCGK